VNKKVLLSLCMIVKDEEEWIDKCLQRVEGVVDEIIIVDTGSMDRTKEICQNYNAYIYDFQWTESFCEARNYGLEKASGEWILWLDADEELEIKNAEEFRSVLKNSERDFWMIELINYYGKLPPDSNRAYLFASYRLFRNHKGIRFEGNIHEHLNLKITSGNEVTEVLPNAKIHHYGYMDMVVENKEKHKRNLYLLQKEKQHSEYSPWIDYHIASEYYRARQYTEAFQQINISILRFLERKKLPPSLLYKLKYDILLCIGSFEGAWPGIENAIALYPEYVDLHFYKGIILYGKGMIKEAIDTFRHCIEIGDGDVRFLTMIGCGGYLAWYYIGRCLEDMGNPSQAIKAYSQSLCLHPEYHEARERLLHLCKDQREK